MLFWLAAVLYSGQSNFELEYLVKFETEFENILGYESVPQMGSFDEKKPKISCYCPFKGSPARSKGVLKKTNNTNQ